MGAWARHHVVTARAWENSEQVALTGCVPVGAWETQVQVSCNDSLSCSIGKIKIYFFRKMAENRKHTVVFK